MTRLLLLRHGESEWNAAGRWQGQADPPLSRWGEQQARRACELLAGPEYAISAVVSSDLERAQATAGILASALKVPLSLDPDLREHDVGTWSGLTRSEIEAEWPGAIADWRSGRLAATPGGERRDALVARVKAAVTRISEARPGQTTLVITHGGVIGALSRSLGADPGGVAHLAGRWFEMTPAGLHAGAAVVLLEPDATARPPSGVMDTGAR